MRAGGAPLPALTVLIWLGFGQAASLSVCVYFQATGRLLGRRRSTSLRVRQAVLAAARLAGAAHSTAASACVQPPPAYPPLPGQGCCPQVVAVASGMAGALPAVADGTSVASGRWGGGSRMGYRVCAPRRRRAEGRGTAPQQHGQRQRCGSTEGDDHGCPSRRLRHPPGEMARRPPMQQADGVGLAWSRHAWGQAPFDCHRARPHWRGVRLEWGRTGCGCAARPAGPMRA